MLKEGDSAQNHIKTSMELFDALSVAGETFSTQSESSMEVYMSEMDGRYKKLSVTEVA